MAENMFYSSDADFNLTSQQRLGLLPIRGEKRLVPLELAWGSNYESISNRTTPNLDFITIRIPQLNRTPFVFRFLINPKTISVAHQTLDSHAMTRAGWQFGVWGEDTIDLHLSGSTAGQFLSNGLTDMLEEYTLSYRNAIELMNVFENNGYSFEGSDITQGNPLAADFARKRIKCQQDVELRVGNFIWKGMFTTMTFSQTADTPFYNKFDLGFLAWKEDYISNSPWRSPIPNNKYRGHALEVINHTTSTVAGTTGLSPSAAQAMGRTNPNAS